MPALLVIGNGMVGQRLVESVRERDRARRWQITVLGEEPRRAYDRVALSSYFDGAGEAELDLVPEGCHDDRWELLLAETAVRIDRTGRAVETDRGRRIGYDALVLATGSTPFVPPIPGRELPGCFVYRTLDDLDRIRAAAARAAASTPGRRSGLVVGGGLLGLEVARALRLLGLSPHVVEPAPRLMPLRVDEGGSGLPRTLIEELDVTVHLATSVERIERDRNRLLATLANGVELDLDLVVFSAGIRPRDELARPLGLADGTGVVVDCAGRTEDESIYAIGECARVDGRVYGLVGPGYAMADVVAERLLGGDSGFAGADTSTRLKLLGVDVASFGDALAETPGALEVTVSNPLERSYAKLVVSDDARTVLGGVLVGDADRYAVLRTLVGRPLPGDPVALLASSGETGAGDRVRASWTAVCRYDELLPERGVAALVGRTQLALFRTFDGMVYALENRDPFTGANVLARGIVGTRAGTAIVISPLYKQAFELGSGRCLDDDGAAVRVYPIRVRDGAVEVVGDAAG